MRVLAIRGGGLGDIILTIPSFLALKKLSKELYLSVPSQWTSLFEGFAELIPLEGRFLSSLWYGGMDLEKFLGNFDIAVTWHWDRDGVFINNLKKIAKEVIVGEIKPSLIHQSENLFSPLYKIDKNIEFPEIIRLPNLPSWNPEGKSEIIIHPGSGSMKKVWPIENFLYITKKFLEENRKVKIILGEAEEKKEFSVFIDLEGINLKRNLPLKEVINELLEGIVYIGNDSGISHLSALLGIPTVVLFKETDPKIWAPKGNKVFILSSYPEKEWIKKEEVFEFVKKIINKNF